MPTAKKKSVLVRNVRWKKTKPFLEEVPVPYFELRAPHLASRFVRGEVGKSILAMGDQGRVIFLDKPPRDWRRHIMVVGYPGGVVIHYFTAFSNSHSYVLPMCSTFRNRLVGGCNKVRWAKVKAT